MIVMSYNIGHYNMGLSQTGYPPEVMDEKVAVLKELYMQFAPDLIGTQEDATYADRAKTIKSNDYLYDPYWRYRPSGSGCNIRARYAAVSGTGGTITFSTGRTCKKIVLRVDGKRLLALSAHPTAHVGFSREREIEYREMFEAVNREEWDWCVITGDFNTTEEVDKLHLQEQCAANGFGMAIGSYLPWVDTYLGKKEGARRHSFDNVLVSGKCAIRRVQVLRDWWERLYSDHVPVLCEIEMG